MRRIVAANAERERARGSWRAHRHKDRVRRNGFVVACVGDRGRLSSFVRVDPGRRRARGSATYLRAREGAPDADAGDDVPAATHAVDGADGDTAAAGTLQGWGVAVRPSGNVLVSGALTGTVDLGLGPLTSAGDLDLVVAELAPSGAPVWNQRFGDGARQSGAKLALDGAGNLFIAAPFQGTIILGTSTWTSAGGWDVVVAELDPAGHPLWSKSMGGAGDETPLGVYADAGGVTVAYRFGSVSAVQGTSVAKLTVAGDPAWTKSWMGVVGDAFAASAAGGALVTGSFRGSVDLGGGALVSAGLTDIFVVELSPAGDWTWNKRFGGYADEEADGLAVTATGELLLAGRFDGPLDLGGATPLLSVQAAGAFAPSFDVFVAKLDAHGAHVWSRQFGDSTVDERVTAAAAAPGGGVVVLGGAGDSIDFGLGALKQPGGGAFVVGIDGDGQAQWNGTLPSPGGAAALVAPNGNVWVPCGLAAGSSFPLAVQTFTGGGDVFLLRYGP